jgi:hypothetical protein
MKKSIGFALRPFKGRRMAARLAAVRVRRLLAGLTLQQQTNGRFRSKMSQLSEIAAFHEIFGPVVITRKLPSPTANQAVVIARAHGGKSVDFTRCRRRHIAG